MTATTLLRSAAVATGLVGLIDPSWTARRPAPVPVEVKAPADLQPAADDVRRNLANRLGNRRDVRLGCRTGSGGAGGQQPADGIARS